MTLRSVIIGLVFAAAIAAFGYINDGVMLVTFLVGNHLPICVFGFLVLYTTIINPLIGGISNRLKLSATELIVITSIALVACSVPGSGHMRLFTSTLALPTHYGETINSWKKTEVLDYAPPGTIVGRKEVTDADGKSKMQYDPEVMDDFISGSTSRGKPIPLTTEAVFSEDHIPWSKWAPALKTWLPFMLLMGLSVICMALIVHRQWSTKERLRYPIADFAVTLTGQKAISGAPNGLFRSRLFWLGLGAILSLRIINGLHAWYGGPDIPLTFDFTAISQLWPELMSTDSGRDLLHVALYPTAVAFAYFLASDVSLSLGMSQLIMVPLTILMLKLGVNMQTHYLAGGVDAWQRFGSYMGMAVLIIYIGRKHYWSLLKGAFFLSTKANEAYLVWACRILLIATATLVVMLASMGVAWPFALLAVLMILMLFLVSSRISAESGLFFLEPWWQPLGVLIGLFGMASLGPSAIITVGMLCVLLCADTRECLMPFMANILKMCETTKIRPSRTAIGAGVVFMLAMAIAIPVVLWANYNYGHPTADWWAHTESPKLPFDTAAKCINQLQLTDSLDQNAQLSTLDRMSGIFANNPEKARFIVSAGAGLALVLVFSFCRLRFPWWPIHPIIFLTWGTYPMRMLSHSFLLGWAIKMAVTKFGSANTYQKTRLFLVGCVAGDLLGGLVFMVAGWWYYCSTGGHAPPTYWVFPP